MPKGLATGATFRSADPGLPRPQRALLSRLMSSKVLRNVAVSVLLPYAGAPIAASQEEIRVDACEETVAAHRPEDADEEGENGDFPTESASGPIGVAGAGATGAAAPQTIRSFGFDSQGPVGAVKIVHGPAATNDDVLPALRKEGTKGGSPG